MDSPSEIAASLSSKIGKLEVKNAPSVRAVRKRFSRELRDSPAEVVMSVARELVGRYGLRGVANELIANHGPTFEMLGEPELRELGQGIDSWWSVDSFARNLSGPAWLAGQIDDQVIHRWARSEDYWWRRAALVSTVALNVRSHGGYGDASRTLEVCHMLADDHEDMVVKALSWALRELVSHDPQAVEAFLAEHDQVLAARVKREVGNKLRTGLKNPSRKHTR